MRNFTLFFDAFLILMLLFAPIYVVQSVLWPLYVLGGLGLLVVATKGIIADTFKKPSWWIYYDVVTDLLFLAAVYLLGLTYLFWLILFVSGSKHFIKRTPYDSQTNSNS